MSLRRFDAHKLDRDICSTFLYRNRNFYLLYLVVIYLLALISYCYLLVDPFPILIQTAKRLLLLLLLLSVPFYFGKSAWPVFSLWQNPPITENLKTKAATRLSLSPNFKKLSYGKQVSLLYIVLTFEAFCSACFHTLVQTQLRCPSRTEECLGSHQEQCWRRDGDEVWWEHFHHQVFRIRVY